MDLDRYAENYPCVRRTENYPRMRRAENYPCTRLMQICIRAHGTICMSMKVDLLVGGSAHRQKCAGEFLRMQGVSARV